MKFEENFSKEGKKTEITDEHGEFINPRPLEDMEEGNEEGGQSMTARERIEQLRERENNENGALAGEMSDDAGERLIPLEDIEKVKND